MATVVSERGSLTLAFAAWAAGRAGPIATVEAAFARLRRRSAPEVPAGSLALAGHVMPVLVPEGTMAAWQALRAGLEPDVVRSVTELAAPLARPPTGEGTEAVLLERTPGGGIAIGRATEPLAALLLAAQEPVPRAALRARARELGADPGEEDEVVDGLIRAGLLDE
jgi:hypothetical protein